MPRVFDVRHILRTTLQGAALLWATLAVVRAQPPLIEAPEPGLNEAGVPPFVVLGPEALGMSSSPVDLQRLPDGRLLVLGNRELAVGDGVRWQVFRLADDQAGIHTERIAVGSDGRAYAGIPGGFGRVEFGTDGGWRLVPVAKVPAAAGLGGATPLGFASPGGEWLWWLSGGSVIAWHPGVPARVLGQAAGPAFIVGRRYYLTDAATGRLECMEAGTPRPVALPPGARFDQTVTCSLPLGGERALVGTLGRGIKLDDGVGVHPLVDRGPLAGPARVNDLCATDGGLFAAALDNFGVVFFDRKGRIVQVLDRSVDPRLSRVNRLLSTPGGEVWALLNDGMARVAFPSRISNFDTLAPTGLAFAQPYRFQGRLWLVSDGRAQRGVYGPDGRLTRFEVDSPGSFVSSLPVLDGVLFAGTSDGIFRRGEHGGWSGAVAGPAAVQVRLDAVAPGRWLYVAENEVGWLRMRGGSLAAERFPAPLLGHPHLALADRAGDFWIELGPARVARVEATLPQPTVHVYGPSQGLAFGWPQIFMIGGGVRLNVADQILRFDPAKDRFAPDRAILRKMPLLDGAIGRPVLDSRGRLWITNLGTVQVVRPERASPGSSVEAMPMGLGPINFAPQSDGVMWMHQDARLVRFDPSMPAPSPVQLRALITNVRLGAADQTVFSPVAGLASIPASGNSMTIHFLAPDNPVGQSVAFDVELQGPGGRWTSAGGSGTAVYSNLAEGKYVFRVRPRIGDEAGREATLTFAVPAPWYRTSPAYAAYGLAAIALVVLTAWLASFLERREKAKLERIVATRTRELNNAVRARLQGEQTLMASETRYRRLFESAKDGILILDADTGVVLDVNPSLAGMLGCPRPEFLDEKVWELEFFKGILAGRTEFENLRQQEYARYDEVVIQRADGSKIEVELVSTVYLVTHRRVMQINIRDITERKLAEQKVLEQAALLDKANDAIYVRTLDRTILYWNQGAERLYGWTREEAVHRKTSDLMAQDAESAERNQEILLKTGTWLGERRQATKSGQIVTVLSRLTLVRDARGEPRTVLSINADVTERKLLEARFLRAQRQESLGLLASGIAHDLNNVLTPIIISSQLLRDFVRDPAGRQMLATIETSAERGAGIVKQVLTFARGVEGERVTLQPKHFIKDMSDIAANTFPKNIRVQTAIAKDLWPIVGDATQLQQALMNLCVNARDAMPTGGVLTLQAENAVLDDDVVRSTPGAKAGPHVRLGVADTGTGIAPELLDRIFDPFFTTKALGKGTGLGLSTVLGIMNSHGGFVRVTSERGRGSCFELNFPAMPAASVAAVRNGQKKAPAGGGELILVVDDELAVREVLRMTLRKHGYKAVVASEGGEAAKIFLQQHAAIAAVITDMMMPGMDGPALVQVLRKIRPEVRIVGMSGGKEEADKAAPWSVPVFLSKPFDSDKVLEAVAEVLGKGGQ
jgi:PAS domain S-box-containing protein